MMKQDDRDDWLWRDVPPLAPPKQRIDGSPLAVVLAWAVLCGAAILVAAILVARACST